MDQLGNLTPTSSQKQALALLRDPRAGRVLARGGRRSGKSVAWSLAVAGRAFMFPGSKHGVFRATLNTCRQLLFLGTFREVMDMAWPGYLDRPDVDTNKQDSTIRFHNGSTIYFRGLDENNLTRQRGAEYGTIWLNEANEVRDFGSVMTLLSSLNHSVPMLAPSGQPVMRQGKPLMMRRKALFDCNPQLNTDWDAQAFKFHLNPASGLPWPDPLFWREIKMDSEGNRANQGEGYLDELRRDLQGMPGALATLVEGEWRDDNPLAMWRPEMLRERVSVTPADLTRCVVALDPTTTFTQNSDEAGIVIVGRLADGRAVVCADYSLRGTPEMWAAATIRAFDEWQADAVIYEENQGGLMVETTLQGKRRNVPCRGVRAKKGKELRAQPVSIAYNRGRVVHQGADDGLKTLEQQMFDFEHIVARRGQSPDRVDALVYGVLEVLDINGDGRPGGALGTIPFRFF